MGLCLFDGVAFSDEVHEQVVSVQFFHLQGAVALFDEIAVGLAEEESQEERQAIRNLFYFFDENGDGKLSKTEAKIGFGRCEYEWDDEMEELFESVKDSDGKVSIEGELLVIKSQS